MTTENENAAVDRTIQKTKRRILAALAMQPMTVDQLAKRLNVAKWAVEAALAKLDHENHASPHRQRQYVTGPLVDVWHAKKV